MDYRWDEAKRAANLAKHGVDFADAIGALEDPAALTLEDSDAQGEPRYVTLGMGFTGRVLLVIWAWERGRQKLSGLQSPLMRPILTSFAVVKRLRRFLARSITTGL